MLPWGPDSRMARRLGLQVAQHLRQTGRESSRISVSNRFLPTQDGVEASNNPLKHASEDTSWLLKETIHSRPSVATAARTHRIHQCDLARRHAYSAGLLIRWSTFVTPHAVETKSEHPLSSAWGCRPLTNCPRRIVPDMLIMAARKLSNPVSFAVLVIASDRLLHQL